MATIEYWTQIENHAWDVAPNNIDRMTGQDMSAVPAEHNKPHSFSHTFTTADAGKTFPYFCSQHGSPGGGRMSGTIAVM
jgi:plastocyanin